jgi:hypothetical protein
VTMHRQDYRLIAQGLREARHDLDEFSLAVADHITNCVANTLAGNPKFDRAFFLAAADWHRQYHTTRQVADLDSSAGQGRE